MKENTKEKKDESKALSLIKLYLSKEVFHITIFLLCVILFSIVFGLFAYQDSTYIETMRRIDATRYKEVALTSEPVPYDNSFRLFNGKLYPIDGDMRSISADVLMPIEDKKYEGNTIGYEGGVSAGECLVSLNVMRESHLKVGDKIYIRSSGLMNKGIEHTIKGVLPSSFGVDEKFKHTGSIVIGEDSPLLEYEFSYMTFLESIDGFTASSKTILLINKVNEVRTKLIIDICIYVAIALAIMIVGELLSFDMRRRYSADVFDGMKHQRVYRKICLDMLVKYYIPFILVGLVTMLIKKLYSVDYLLLCLGWMLVLVLGTLIMSVVYYRRNYR